MNKRNKPARVPWALRDIAGLVFPQRCPVCDRPLPFGPRTTAPLSASGTDPFFHPDCFRKLSIAGERYCLRCGCPLQENETEYCRSCRTASFSFIRNLPLLLYNEAARASVAYFKYRGRQEYALPYARLWMGFRGEELTAVKPDVLIPVPIHRSRLRKRGYNQAALFAYELEKLSGIPCREDILIRSKHTGAQKELGRKERLANMENAFRLKNSPEGIHCAVLVDDIFTTGSTLESCSRVLKAAGVERIYTLTLCVASE